MFHHAWHFGGSPPPPREHFEYPNGSPILNAKYARKKYGRSAQSGRMTSPIESSLRPKWLNRTLRVRSRSTSCSAFHDAAAGDATSANQKYGGPPYRSRDLATTFPSGAISESSPSSGFSAAKMTRKGAPFHGAIGEGKTASSAASSQAPDGPSACASTAEKRNT